MWNGCGRFKLRKIGIVALWHKNPIYTLYGNMCDVPYVYVYIKFSHARGNVRKCATVPQYQKNGYK